MALQARLQPEKLPLHPDSRLLLPKPRATLTLSLILPHPRQEMRLIPPRQRDLKRSTHRQTPTNRNNNSNIAQLSDDSSPIYLLLPQIIENIISQNNSTLKANSQVTVTLYPTLTLVIVTTNGQSVKNQTPVTQEQVTAVIETIRSNYPDGNYQEAAKQLYQWLLEPIEDQLTQEDASVAEIMGQVMQSLGCLS